MKIGKYPKKPGLTCYNLSARYLLTQPASVYHPFSTYAKISDILTPLLPLVYKHIHLRALFPYTQVLIVINVPPNSTSACFLFSNEMNHIANEPTARFASVVLNLSEAENGSKSEGINHECYKLLSTSHFVDLVSSTFNRFWKIRLQPSFFWGQNLQIGIKWLF